MITCKLFCVGFKLHSFHFVMAMLGYKKPECKRPSILWPLQFNLHLPSSVKFQTYDGKFCSTRFHSLRFYNAFSNNPRVCVLCSVCVFSFFLGVIRRSCVGIHPSNSIVHMSTQRCCTWDLQPLCNVLPILISQPLLLVSN